MPPTEALKSLGDFINKSLDTKDPNSLRRAIHRAHSLRTRLSNPLENAHLDWFEANAWYGIRRIAHTQNRDASWDWEQPELENEIFLLRRAARLGKKTEQMPAAGMCRILTNLGNALDTVGRFVEAIPCWEEALSSVPGFSMAQGNLGIGLATYGRVLWETRERRAFFERAYSKLSDLGQDVEPHANDRFTETRRKVEEVLNKKRRQESNLPDERPEDPAEGRLYRQWCSQHTLILNPLNDLGPSVPGAENDNLVLHSISTHIDEQPYHHGFFNQLKQEYVSARWLLYEGVTARSPHFSDHRVAISDTMDYPVYGLGVEKIKLAFRSAYSLFDKIAYFVNAYFQLGVHERAVHFRWIWYVGDREEGILASSFQRPRNLPLRGLFWLSKDLFGGPKESRRGTEPDAAKLKDVREHLEHKYLKVHDLWGDESTNRDMLASLYFRDELAHSVGRKELEAMTLRLFRLARASLLYLSLAVANEEHRRRKVRGKSEPALPMVLDRFDDGRKM